MRLPNFLEFTPLNRLREMMGAELKQWSPGLDWIGFDPEEWRKLQTIGIEVKLEDVILADDGTLEWQGHKVILYIRDQRNSGYQGETSSYKFHVANCTTLHEMNRKGRYERYVVATRKDGKFIVNRFDWNVLVEKEVECELPVCRNCLRRLKYQDYNYQSRFRKNQIVENFDLVDFFDKYPSRITKFPKHTDKTAPLDTYSPGWETISSRYRESVNWTCERCGVNLKDHKSFLQVHHLNGVKSDNDRQNFQALCIRCHAQKPDHEHLRNSPDFLKYAQMPFSY